MLLNGIAPLSLAGLIYLGAGMGMLVVMGLGSIARTPFRGSPISRGDLPWLAGSVAIGSVIAPALLMWSVSRTSALTASLLLSFEAVAAALIACLLFGELIGRRVWVALGCITTACIALAYTPGHMGISPGTLGVLAVAVLWGLTASINRRLSGCEPGRVVMVKCTAAGLILVCTGALAGDPLPSGNTILAAMTIGFVAYGLSNLFLMRALRVLGAARTSSVYGICPILGTILSVIVLGESLDLLTIAALPVMITGVALIITEGDNGKEITDLARSLRRRHVGRPRPLHLFPGRKRGSYGRHAIRAHAIRPQNDRRV